MLSPSPSSQLARIWPPAAPSGPNGKPGYSKVEAMFEPLLFDAVAARRYGLIVALSSSQDAHAVVVSLTC